MTSSPDRIDGTSEAGRRLDPLTWQLDEPSVVRIWKSTVEVFGNKLWVEDLTEGDIPLKWQDELEKRSGKGFFDILVESTGGLGRGDDPSLVFVGFQREFAKYGITLECARHPFHGDVIARGRDLEAAGLKHPPYSQLTWEISVAEVAELWEEDAEDPDEFAESLAALLGDERLDEVQRRYEDELSILVNLAVEDAVDPGDLDAVLAQLGVAFAGCGITLAIRP